MKTNYPKYKQGKLQQLQKKLSPNNKHILNEFTNLCLITAGEKRVQKIRRHMIQFYDIIGKDFDNLTKEDVNSFLVVLNKSDRSIATKNEIKIYVKKFLMWHYKDLDIIENIKAEKENELDKRINESNLLEEKDIEKMLRFAENFKEKAYLFLVFESGARPQELVNLKWQDIKFCDGYADITLYSNKTRDTRTFPVKKAAKFLNEWKQNYSFPDVKLSDYVFPYRDRNKPMTTAGLNKILRRMSKKAGLNKDVWTYLFRHTRATKLYEELPQPIVEKLMGHKNMAEIYAHISTKKAREMMLEKIYHIEEISESYKDKIENKLIELYKENKEWKKWAKEIGKEILKFKKENLRTQKIMGEKGLLKK